MSDGTILASRYPEDALKCSDCAYHRLPATMNPCKDCLQSFGIDSYGFVGRDDLRYYAIKAKLDKITDDAFISTEDFRAKQSEEIQKG